MLSTMSAIESDANSDYGVSGPTAARFDPLELRVLQLVAAGHERAKPASPIGKALLGRRGGAPLADSRLEALRREAIAVFNGGRESVSDFFAAGYTALQLDAVRAMMAAARPKVSADRLAHAGGITLGVGAIAGFLALTASLLTHI